MNRSDDAAPDGPASLRAALRSRLLALAEEELVGGNMAGVLHAIIAAAAGNQPLPEWARVALWRIDRGLSSGEIADLNEAFGWSKEATCKAAPLWAKEVLMRYRVSAGLPVDLDGDYVLRTEAKGHLAARRSESKRRRDSPLVLMALTNARRQGCPMSVPTFEELAAQLGESRAFIEKVYREHAKRILATEPGPEVSGGAVDLSYWD